MLRLEGIGKDLGDFSLRDVSFEVASGEYFALLGASGVGKTVLLEIIAGLIPPDRGTVFLDGKDVTFEPIQRRRIGLVYQDQALFPHLTARDNIAYGLRCRRLPRARIAERTAALADQVGASHILARLPSTLSGGEAQRVALARTLACEPRCLLLDEPISSLDMKARSEARALLRKLNRLGHTILHVTHDFEEAISLASRIAVMEQGAVAQTGAADEIFRRPKSEFAAHFVGIRNFFKGVLSAADARLAGLAEFEVAGLILHVVTDVPSGPGHVMIRSEDVTLSLSRPQSSALNTFPGRIVDIAPARLGVEVSIDIGLELSALVTPTSVQALDLRCGKTVWISFKATAVKFIEE